MSSQLPIGVGVAFGMVVGAVLAAVTQYPPWIAIGAPFGAATGAAFQRLRRGRERGSRQSA